VKRLTVFLLIICHLKVRGHPLVFSEGLHRQCVFETQPCVLWGWGWWWWAVVFL